MESKTRPAIVNYSHRDDVDARQPGMPCSVTIEWCDHGSPHCSSTDALAERMKRVEEAAKSFLGTLYEEAPDA